MGEKTEYMGVLRDTEATTVLYRPLERLSPEAVEEVEAEAKPGFTKIVIGPYGSEVVIGAQYKDKTVITDADILRLNHFGEW